MTSPDLDDADLRAVLGTALSSGAGFAELYAEQRRVRAVSVDDGRIEDLVTGLDRGGGVRVVHDGQTAYAFTNLLTRDALVEAAGIAAAAVSGSQRTRVADLTTVQPPYQHPARRDPAELAGRDLAAIVQRIDESARAVDGAVRQVAASYGDTVQDVLLANSDGHLHRERRVRSRVTARVVAARDGVIQTGLEAPGAAAGPELLDDHPPEQVGRMAAERAVLMLDSRPAPAGEMTVVLAPGSGGVLFHEACGHGMEADIVAKGASVYRGRRGDRIGSELISGVDDATVANAWGSFGFDDEGTPAQRTVLFERGVCTDYMTDRLRAAELGLPLSGNARRQSYAHLPIPRMTNTYISSGADDPAEMVRSVRRGLFCEQLGGGQVDPASGDFVFGVAVGWLIEDGQLTHPVRGANLVGDGPTILARIDAVGTDFDTREGICGKDGQGVPAGLGNPTVRIDRITVGGTGE
ncbi:MAG TPA: TldD/PmbA family protein [Euzebyales bacterium]|nr:TldD/PmbA family protein [Euzebyales bacterium]